jgi:tetratricopeptide (TPR) repeat protein
MKMRLALVAVLFAAHAHAAAFPWTQDKTALDAAIADVQSAGLKAVEPHAAALETALGHAANSFALAGGDPVTAYVLIDGPTDTPTALMAASLAIKDKKLVAVFNPYPGIAFFLGSYYDLVGRPDDALRVLDAALALPDQDRSEHRTDLLVERGTALAALKRFKEAVKSYDAALAIPGGATAVRAFVYRSRGDALAALGRAKESKASYARAADLLEGNLKAERELALIVRFKSGVPPESKPGG